MWVEQKERQTVRVEVGPACDGCERRCLRRRLPLIRGDDVAARAPSSRDLLAAPDIRDLRPADVGDGSDHKESDYRASSVHRMVFLSRGPTLGTWIDCRYARMALISCTSNTNSGMSGWPVERPSAKASWRASTGYR